MTATRRPQAGHGVPNEARFGVSQVIVADGFAHVAGQIARDRSGRSQQATTFAEHAEHALANLDAILSAVGFARDDVVWVESHDVDEPAAAAARHPSWFDPGHTSGVIVSIDGLYDPAYRLEVTTVAAHRDLHRQALPGPPGAPFARAIRAGNQVYVSGHDGLQAGPAGDIATQFARALDCVIACVGKLGGSADDVVSTHIYVVGDVDTTDLQAIAEAHRLRFAGVNRPTTNLIGVRRLTDPRALVEVCGVAVCDAASSPSVKVQRVEKEAADQPPGILATVVVDGAHDRRLSVRPWPT